MRPIPVDEREVIERLRTSQNHLTDSITGFVGSMRYVYIHAAWLGVWIVINAGLFGAALIFDPFPYGLLTMIVSLEANLSLHIRHDQPEPAGGPRRSPFRARLRNERPLRDLIGAHRPPARIGPARS
jgi:Protein of unknown function (DUF1003)